jgi:hypothetical protein
LAEGDRPRLLTASQSARDAGIGPALELLSPASGTSEWSGARFTGTAGVEGEAARLRTTTGLKWSTLSTPHATSFRDILAAAALAGSSTLRLGCLASAFGSTLQLLDAKAGPGPTFLGTGSGQVRWSGETDSGRVGELRRALAARDVPLTIERAPWPLRRVAGHFGALRTGVPPILASLRSLIDPGGSIVVALEGEHG